MHARHSAAASTIRGICRPSCRVPFRIHIPQKGRKIAIEALLSVMRPHNSPKAAHRLVVAGSSSAGPPMFLMRSARTRMQLKRKAVSDISQTHFTAYCIAAGYSAQIHADQTATCRLKQRIAISHVDHTVSAEQTQLKARITHAENAV